MTKSKLNISGPMTMGEILKAYERMEKAAQSAHAGRNLRIR